MENKFLNFIELERKVYEIFNSFILFFFLDVVLVFSDELLRVIEVIENN